MLYQILLASRCQSAPAAPAAPDGNCMELRAPFKVKHFDDIGTFRDYRLSRKLPLSYNPNL